MSIGVDCPGCRTSFQVDPKHAGKLGQCPHCRARVRVPQLAAVPVAPVRIESRRPILDPDDDGEAYGLASEAATLVAAQVRAARAARAEAAPAAAPADGALVRSPARSRSPREILAALRGEIEPVRPTGSYRAWIVGIAVVMVILPVVYLGLIGVVGSAVFWHITHNHAIFQSVGTNKLTLLIYLAPILAGGVVMAFLLKPLFARSTRDAKVRRLDPGKEPLLFSFVDGVCNAIGAPTPSRIEVSCEVNASAHLATWALSPAKELVLTIGLPLVAGLTLRQFTGVLAHEFGHFSQGAGMRLSVLIRSINLWFARVVYERDEWDQTLLGWSSPDNGAGMIFGLAIRGAVWLTRRVLWVLMHVGHLVSGFLSRQMEFDADRYQTRMVGGKTLATTLEQVNFLSFASQAAHADLSNHWRERRLPDDLAKLVLVKHSEFGPELKTAFRDSTAAARTGLFDTHPSDSDRVASALAEETRGIFKLDGAATELFRDFDSLSRATTLDYYRAQLGREVSKAQLYPVAEALLNQEVEREGNQAIDRFFLGALRLFQPIPLPADYPRPPSDPRAAKRHLGDLRRAMLARRSVHLTMAGRWTEATGRALKADAAIALFKADKKVAAAVVGLPKATLGAAEQARDAAGASLDYILTEFEPYTATAAERLVLALGLLELDLVVERVPDGAVLRDEARSLHSAAVLLGGRVVPELGSLITALGSLNFLIGLFQEGKNDHDQPMIQAMLRAARRVHDQLTTLRWKIGDVVTYPFEHAEPGISLGRFALPVLPAPEAIGDLVQTGTEARDRLLDLHRRVLGRLAATAEAVERGVGLSTRSSMPSRGSASVGSPCPSCPPPRRSATWSRPGPRRGTASSTCTGASSAGWPPQPRRSSAAWACRRSRSLAPAGADDRAGSGQGGPRQNRV